jgi:hypothetical protein
MKKLNLQKKEEKPSELSLLTQVEINKNDLLPVDVTDAVLYQKIKEWDAKVLLPEERVLLAYQGCDFVVLPKLEDPFSDTPQAHEYRKAGTVTTLFTTNFQECQFYRSLRVQANYSVDGVSLVVNYQQRQGFHRSKLKNPNLRPQLALLLTPPDFDLAAFSKGEKELAPCTGNFGNSYVIVQFTN